jgi:hypothetical protein
LITLLLHTLFLRYPLQKKKKKGRTWSHEGKRKKKKKAEKVDIKNKK